MTQERCAGIPVRGTVLSHVHGIVRAPTGWLQDLCDPLASPPWEVAPITPHDVWDRVTAGDFTHCDARARDVAPWKRPVCRECDIRRIAEFVVAGWPDADEAHPITVDLGVGTYWPGWVVTDGNHRLAAALVRGDAFVDVATAGDWDRCLRVLVDGVSVWDLAD